MATVKGLTVDNRLLETAMLMGGKKTPKETVNMALEEFIRRRRTEELISMFHTLDFDSDYDYKTMRQRNMMEHEEVKSPLQLALH
jgi:Arc/MetJ family transcription regulator